jgi:hypothetical protein
MNRFSLTLAVSVGSSVACGSEGGPEGYHDRCLSDQDCVSPLTCLPFDDGQVCSLPCQAEEPGDTVEDRDDCPVLPSGCGAAAPCLQGTCGPDVECP